MNAAGPRRVSLVLAGGLPALPTPTIGAPTGDRPAARGLTPAPTGFAFHAQARPSTPTASSSRRTAHRPSWVSDGSFSFRGSPPRLAATQLRFDTARFFTAQERTSTALFPRLLRRTSADMLVRFADCPGPPGGQECPRSFGHAGQNHWRENQVVVVGQFTISLRDRYSIDAVVTRLSPAPSIPNCSPAPAAWPGKQPGNPDSPDQ